MSSCKWPAQWLYRSLTYVYSEKEDERSALERLNQDAGKHVQSVETLLSSLRAQVQNKSEEVQSQSSKHSTAHADLTRDLDIDKTIKDFLVPLKKRELFNTEDDPSFAIREAEHERAGLLS